MLGDIGDNIEGKVDDEGFNIGGSATVMFNRSTKGFPYFPINPQNGHNDKQSCNTFKTKILNFESLLLNI